jgi:uridine kinase
MDTTKRTDEIGMPATKAPVQGLTGGNPKCEKPQREKICKKEREEKFDLSFPFDVSCDVQEVFSGNITMLNPRRRVNNRHRCIVISGVSGTGKSTMAAILARSYEWEYIEGDDFYRSRFDVRPKVRLSNGEEVTNWDHPDMIDWDHLNRTVNMALETKDVVLATFAPCLHLMDFEVDMNIMLSLGRGALQKCIDARAKSKPDLKNKERDALMVREVVFPRFIWNQGRPDCVIDVFRGNKRRDVQETLKDILYCTSHFNVIERNVKAIKQVRCFSERCTTSTLSTDQRMTIADMKWRTEEKLSKAFGSWENSQDPEVIPPAPRLVGIEENPGPVAYGTVNFIIASGSGGGTVTTPIIVTTGAKIVRAKLQVVLCPNMVARTGNNNNIQYSCSVRTTAGTGSVAICGCVSERWDPDSANTSIKGVAKSGWSNRTTGSPAWMSSLPGTLELRIDYSRQALIDQAYRVTYSFEYEVGDVLPTEVLIINTPLEPVPIYFPPNSDPVSITIPVEELPLWVSYAPKVDRERSLLSRAESILDFIEVNMAGNMPIVENGTNQGTGITKVENNEGYSECKAEGNNQATHALNGNTSATNQQLRDLMAKLNSATPIAKLGIGRELKVVRDRLQYEMQNGIVDEKPKRRFIVAPSGSGKTTIVSLTKGTIDADTIFKWPKKDRWWEDQALAKETNLNNKAILEEWLQGERDGKVILYADTLGVKPDFFVSIPDYNLKQHLMNERKGQPGIKDFQDIKEGEKREIAKFPDVQVVRSWAKLDLDWKELTPISGNYYNALSSYTSVIEFEIDEEDDLFIEMEVEVSKNDSPGKGKEEKATTQEVQQGWRKKKEKPVAEIVPLHKKNDEIELKGVVERRNNYIEQMDRWKKKVDNNAQKLLGLMMQRIADGRSMSKGQLETLFVEAGLRAEWLKLAENFNDAVTIMLTWLAHYEKPLEAKRLMQSVAERVRGLGLRMFFIHGAENYDLLMQDGDVELNPGPEYEEEEILINPDTGFQILPPTVKYPENVPRISAAQATAQFVLESEINHFLSQGLAEVTSSILEDKLRELEHDPNTFETLLGHMSNSMGYKHLGPSYTDAIIGRSNGVAGLASRLLMDPEEMRMIHELTRGEIPKATKNIVDTIAHKHDADVTFAKTKEELDLADEHAIDLALIVAGSPEATMKERAEAGVMLSALGANKAVRAITGKDPYKFNVWDFLKAPKNKDLDGGPTEKVAETGMSNYDLLKRSNPDLNNPGPVDVQALLAMVKQWFKVLAESGSSRVETTPAGFKKIQHPACRSVILPELVAFLEPRAIKQNRAYITANTGRVARIDSAIDIHTFWPPTLAPGGNLPLTMGGTWFSQSAGMGPAVRFTDYGMQYENWGEKDNIIAALKVNGTIFNGTEGMEMWNQIRAAVGDSEVSMVGSMATKWCKLFMYASSMNASFHRSSLHNILLKTFVTPVNVTLGAMMPVHSARDGAPWTLHLAMVKEQNYNDYVLGRVGLPAGLQNTLVKWVLVPTVELSANRTNQEALLLKLLLEIPAPAFQLNIQSTVQSPLAGLGLAGNSNSMYSKWVEDAPPNANRSITLVIVPLVYNVIPGRAGVVNQNTESNLLAPLPAMNNWRAAPDTNNRNPFDANYTATADLSGPISVLLQAQWDIDATAFLNKTVSNLACVSSREDVEQGLFMAAQHLTFHLPGSYALPEVVVGAIQTSGMFAMAPDADWAIPTLTAPLAAALLENATRPWMQWLGNVDGISRETVPTINEYTTYCMYKLLLRWKNPASPNIQFDWSNLGAGLADAAIILALQADDYMGQTETSFNANTGRSVSLGFSPVDFCSQLSEGLHGTTLEYGPAPISVRPEQLPLRNMAEWTNVGRRVLDSSLVLWPTYSTSLTKMSIDLIKQAEGMTPVTRISAAQGPTVFGGTQNMYISKTNAKELLKAMMSIVPFGTVAAGVANRFTTVQFGAVEKDTQFFQYYSIKISTESSHNWFGPMVYNVVPAARPYYATTEETDIVMFGPQLGYDVEFGIAAFSAKALRKENNWFESVEIGKLGTEQEPFNNYVPINAAQSRVLAMFGKKVESNDP